MDCKDNNRMHGPKLGLIMGTAIASIALAGCTTSAAPRADVSFNKAQVALQKGQASKAVTHAEAAVLAEPRNAEYRAMLGAAYLESGRFESAASSFDDAMQLGDEDPRTVLSYALAKTATGDNKSALRVLQRAQRDLDPADLGLALALAGAPERGVHVLTNAIRGGQNTPKVRQNLAYTYALSGNWRGARIMAAEDVPADQLDVRLSEWANTSKAEDYQVRVANLLTVDAVTDYGQPQHLALSNFPSDAQLFAEAEAQAPVVVAANAPVEAATKPEPTPVVAKPAAPKPAAVVAQAAPAPKPAVAKPAVAKPAVAKPAPKPAPAVAQLDPAQPRFVSNPVVQKVPASARGTIAARSSQRRMAVASSHPSADTHMVQLGAYDTREGAKWGWKTLKRKFPQLADHDVVITKAEVKGKTFYRVAAAGFGLGGARSMCSTVRKTGRGCFAYAKSNPPAGAIDSGVRIAARTR